MVTVEIDLYSGRPNPRWMLSAADSAEARARLRALPELSESAAATAPVPPDLGYRGLRCDDDGAVARIFGGTMWRDGHIFADADRSLERWLVDRRPDGLANPLSLS